MTQADILAYRPTLVSIAFKMVGCFSIAEDLVHDTFLNVLSKIDQTKISNTKAYLVRSVTNACLNHLESIKQKKEEWLEGFSPSIPDFKIVPEMSTIDFKQELTEAFAQLFKKLPPAERAVFVLKELFNFDYSELTEILGQKAENCRQLFSRAHKKLNESKVRFNPDMEKLSVTVDQFTNATKGEFGDLIDGLKEDIELKK